MSKEHNEELGRSLVKMALQTSLQEPESFSPPSESHDTSDMEQQKSLFYNNVELSIAAHHLGVSTEAWKQRVSQDRETLLNGYSVLGSASSALEIERAYCSYLVKIGHPHEAIAHAVHLKEKYTSSFPELVDITNHVVRLAAIFEQRAIDAAIPRTLADIAILLINDNNVELAQVALDGVDLDTYGYDYYAQLLGFYEKQNNRQAIEKLIVELQARIDTNGENYNLTIQMSLLTSTIKRAQRYLVGEEQSQTEVAPVTDLQGNLRNQITRVSALLDQGGTSQAGDEIAQFIDTIKQNTRDDQTPELNDQALGSLGFVTDYQEKAVFLTPEDSVWIMLDLAGVLFQSQHPELKYTEIQQFIKETAAQVDKQRSPFIWDRYVRIAAQTKNEKYLDDAYALALAAYAPASNNLPNPNYDGVFAPVYALELLAINPEKAFSFIRNFSRQEVATITLAEMIFRQYRKGESLNNFKDHMTWLVNIDARNSSTETSIFDFEDLFSSEPTDDADKVSDDFQEITTADGGGFTIMAEGAADTRPKKKPAMIMPILLGEVAKQAILNQDWDTFAKVLKNAQLHGKRKADVIAVATDWVIKSKPIPDSFFVGKK